jgi:hypothetical protein
MEDVWIACMDATVRPSEGHRERGGPSALAGNFGDEEG